MKQIDIVCGFFESGKTHFIKRFIKEELSGVYDSILVISTERGIEDYSDIDSCVSVEFLKGRVNFSNENVNRLIEKHNPEYVIIEYNGTYELEDCIGMKFPKKYDIRNVITVIDSGTFSNYILNMKNIMIDKISNSDVIVFNRAESDLKVINDRDKIAGKINPEARIVYDEELFRESFGFINNSSLTASDIALIKPFLFIIAFFAIVKGISFLFPQFYDERLTKMFVVFISILIQVIPFLIIGSFLSAVIQVFVPRDRFLGVFEKTSAKSIILSLFMGFFFPVCDCAMVPVVNQLAKKGASLPAVITFLLAAPAVNPIVILSTYYAFSRSSNIVVLRIVLGLTVALVMGIFLYLLEKKDVEITKEYVNRLSKYETLNEKIVLKNNLGKVEAIVRHIKNEFFRIGSYIVAGSFISAAIQVFVPKAVFINLSGHSMVSVLVMVAASVFISVCSTSNAFIARIFYQSMPINSILAFIVMGPMVDITNLVVLSSTFKKRFILGLLAGLFAISLVVFSILGVMLNV